MLSRAACLGLAFVMTIAASEARAQIAPPGEPGPYVIDLRGATAGVPQAFEFYPDLPDGTQVPARGFGFDVGAHVYVLSLGPARIGLGASLVYVRATTTGLIGPGTSPTSSTSPPTSTTGTTPSTSGTTATDGGTLDLEATVRLIAPQISFNFGTGRGWSYLSAGLGTGRMTVAAAGSALEAEARRENDSVRSLNVGGGARWFLSSHFGVGFDVRMHKLSAGTAAAGGSVPATPGTTLFSAAVGFSVK